ncbi:MAG TPA: crosslink repair DNA glycosylase YcaQ family protein, partial [Anaerolineales bacterium]|nr:crosslink repair DNA glycosylase YcaQ family protein [Anaerolineales bacterium]
MPPETISIAEARRIMLTAQGLAHGLAQPPPRKAEKADVLAMIRRMNLLQIDTINVIARSPYLVLWSRLGDYPPAWVDELLEEGALFEYWAHALCFLPIEDFPLYRRRMLDGVRGWGDTDEWIRQHAGTVAMILQRIREEGGLRSADFKNDHHPAGGWWNWKEEKTALEVLFIRGDLMSARRQRFQRVYDLPERVLPGWEDGPEYA